MHFHTAELSNGQLFHVKSHKGEDSEGHIRTDNFIWTDDETELLLKQQPASSAGRQVSVNILTYGTQYCAVNVKAGNW